MSREISRELKSARREQRAFSDNSFVTLCAGGGLEKTRASSMVLSSERGSSGRLYGYIFFEKYKVVS